MLASFRKLAGTWPARILFLVLGASFMSWGVADVVTRVASGGTDVATVDGHAITPAEFQAEFQREMRQIAQRFPDPNAMPPGVRETVARQTLDKLVTQAALAAEVKRLGITAPDDAVRDAVFAIPSFQGPDGKFSRTTMLQVLQNNGLTEAHFLDLIRQDVAQNQIVGAVQSSGAPSDMMTKLVFQYLNEKRTADILELPFASRPVPPSPDEAVLKRFYTNNPARYTAPEYRHIKVVVLSPASIGRSLAVSDTDLHGWFDQHKGEFVSPEKRSMQVLTTDKQSVADQLAAQWKAGASWAVMQDAAKQAGASATPLDDATADQVPSPELAKAAFAAQPNAVTGPIHEPLGYQVLVVTKVTPAKNPSFDQLKPLIHDKAAAEKATDLVDARAQKLQDLFAGGAKMDEVPADLGAAGASGTLDAQGKTKDGEPAPLPAMGDVRQQIIDAAFKANPNDQIQPTEGPDHTWYAVAVDSIDKPAKLPFDQVRDRVLADWRADQVHHEQEANAARILALVKGGQTLKAAAWGSGLQVTRTPPLGRNKPAPGVPAEVVGTLFTLKPPGAGPQGATMVETNAGFVVASLADIIKPDPKSDEAELGQARDGLTRALREDMIGLYAQALKDRAKPKINPRVLTSMVQQPGE